MNVPLKITISYLIYNAIDHGATIRIIGATTNPCGRPIVAQHDNLSNATSFLPIGLAHRLLGAFYEVQENANGAGAFDVGVLARNKGSYVCIYL